MAKEWVKEAQNDVKNEAYLHFEAEKALRARKEENTELLSKLAAEKRERERERERVLKQGRGMPRLKLRTNTSCSIKLN